MKRIVSIFSKPKLIIALAVVSLCLGWLSVGRPFGTGQLRQISGGIGPLDMKMTYSSETAFTALKRMGYAGRAFYRSWLCLDFVSALFSMLFQTALISYLINRLRLCRKWKFLNLFPVMKWLFDCVENILLLFMLSQFPFKPQVTAGIAGYMTFLKWSALFITLISLLGLLLAAGRKAFKNFTHA